MTPEHLAPYCRKELQQLIEGARNPTAVSAYSVVSPKGRTMRRLIIFLLAVLVMTGCAKPLPPERSSYVGEWQSSTMAVLITQDGHVAYKRLVGSNGSKTINGPLQSFDGNNFIVGIGPLKTTFVVSAPPHDDHGIWKMTVDGVELTRQ
jgi:hypothetical protein